MKADKLPEQAFLLEQSSIKTADTNWNFVLRSLFVSILSIIVVLFVLSSVTTDDSFVTFQDLKRKPDDASDNVVSTRKPNIVFILADDLGWNSIGYEPYDLSFTTPFLTDLAQQGIVMTNYYAQEVCTPSRAALMTGRYPITIGKKLLILPFTDILMRFFSRAL